MTVTELLRYIQNEIYPTAKSQKALTVFQLYEGSGEWFDLSKKPVERASFTFRRKREKVTLLQAPASAAAPVNPSVRKAVLISLGRQR